MSEAFGAKGVPYACLIETRMVPSACCCHNSRAPCSTSSALLMALGTVVVPVGARCDSKRPAALTS